MPRRITMPPLGEHDDAWLRVWSALTGRPVAVQAAQLVAFRVRERKQQIQDMLEYSAQIRGVSPDELFNLILANPRYLVDNPAPGDASVDVAEDEES